MGIAFKSQNSCNFRKGLSKFSMHHFILLIFLLSPLSASAGEITYEHAWSVKGGVATLGNDTYIVLNDAQNKVITNTGTWIGKSSNQYEIILTDGLRISETVTALDPAKLKIVIFAPTDVRIIDLKENKSYKYSRPHQP